MTPSLRWPLAVTASTLALVALLIADAQGAPRVAAALWFLLACPGMAVVPLLSEVPAVARSALVVALSLAIDTAVITAMLAADLFSTATGALALSGICVAGCAAQGRKWASARTANEVRMHE
jgi:hypothetical protein